MAIEVPEAELVNEFEYQYYGFSPAGFTDSIYNSALASWEGAVGEWVKSESSLASIANNKKFREYVIGMIFHRREVKDAFRVFTDRVLKYILRIPRYVTLPEHEPNFELSLSNEVTVTEMERNCEVLAKMIVENRFVLNDLTNNLQEANDVNEVLSSLIKKLEVTNDNMMTD
ncbi:unnamed protein product [Cylicocyclus nassatus]|uniref:Uncharacterized protein n=1 Tax=Cylicocyclus nassatus TaxID=53992 RepID=A0AA36GH16_CYLNA|nr:unnamed protein product [Cylicocyclus nassatus]